MTPPKKPDWMEIADGDGGSTNPVTPGRKSRPLLIAATALVLTFGGAVIAQSNEDSPTTTDQSIVPQSSQSATSVAPAIKQGDATVAPSAPGAPSAQAAPRAIKPPAIATPPNMKGGDDDEDEDGEHEGRERGEHEGRERGEHDDDDDDFEEH
jgi:hypothetical protein